jgi:hypothetical protein
MGQSAKKRPHQQEARKKKAVVAHEGHYRFSD